MVRFARCWIVITVAACDAFPFGSIDDFVGDGGTADQSVLDQIAPDAAADASDADASSASDADAEAGCQTGTPLAPLQVVVATPPTLTGAHVCNVQNAAAKDGQFAELEETISESATVLNEPISTCVAATFAGNLSSAVISAKSENAACTTSCSPDGGCGTGHTVVILGGTSTNVFAATFIDTPSFTTSESDKTETFPTDVSVVFFCRNGTQPYRDIPAVDAIVGTCR